MTSPRSSERIERIRNGVLLASGDIPKKQIADEIGCNPTTVSSLISFRRLGFEMQDAFERWLKEKSYWSQVTHTPLFTDVVREKYDPKAPTGRRSIVAELTTEDIMRAARDARKINRIDLRDKLDELADQVDLIREQVDEINGELQAIEQQFKSYEDEVRREYAGGVRAKPLPPPKREPHM